MRRCLVLIIFLIASSCKDYNDFEDQRIFTSLNPNSSGIDFINQLDYDESFNVYLFKSFYNGAGVGIGDFNNDGLQDVFFCGNQVDNKLYINLGNFNFEELEDTAGLASSGAWSMGVSIVDINGDGWQDIYICKSGMADSPNRRNELFMNTGILDANNNPSFKKAAESLGINDLGYSVHASFFDFDRDGDLDMYLLNNSLRPTDVVLNAEKGLRDVFDEEGGNKLYRNDGEVFTDITKKAGIYSSSIGFGLGVAISDVNDDGWQDIYVANDFFEMDYLYINQTDGTFKESIEKSISEMSLGAMGADFADLNHDGRPELFVTEMLPKDHRRLKTKALFDSWDAYRFKYQNGYQKQFPRNSLQLNMGLNPQNGQVIFSEISRQAEVAATDWSWGVQMLDLDNNGSVEIFVTNGVVKDLLDQDYLDFYSDPAKVRKIYKEKGAVIKELIDIIPSEPIPNCLFKLTDEFSYENVTEKWGLATPSFSTGSAFGDLDNDGDLDLVVSNNNDKPFLYRNETQQQALNNFLNIRLKGSGKNKDAIGAKVCIVSGGQKYFQEVNPMRGSMSTIDKRLSFGLGVNTSVDSLWVRWPNGTKSIMTNVDVNQFLTIDESELEIITENETSLAGPTIFNKLSDPIPVDYVHKEDDFIDFHRDYLLTHSISNEGPPIAIGDVDNDGFTDFYVGGAMGYAGVLYITEKMNGHFKKSAQNAFEQDKASEDTDAVFADIDGDNDIDLLVASGGYVHSPNSFALANRIYINDGYGNFIRSDKRGFNRELSSTSCIKVHDFNGDSLVDLFIGERLVPLNYGIPASSSLLLNDGQGDFYDATTKLAPGLKEIGMVTDAVWFDYDNDFDEDLVIVGDWMPVKLFENKDGKLNEISQEIGLDSTNGFWNTVKTEDLDNDGFLDIVAGNLGENTFIKASASHPVRMHLNDFDSNGDIDHIISTYYGENSYPISTKKEITNQLPYLLKKYLKHEDFSNQTIEDIFEPKQLQTAILLKVYNTSSGVFWNEKGNFKFKKFPAIAQVSPIYAILPLEINKDGRIDLLMGGNQSIAKPQIGIYEGSNGILLKGTKERNFTGVDFITSGFYTKGEVRDLSVIKKNNSKNIILVAKSNEQLEIYEY